ncbi:MAG: homoserine O-acetyltransferase [Porticoccaceae bacterium]|nr:homoserine O-acetyltransferase [Porticoccaceae bacterium]MDG1474293.1 homoserine O-acetyltransferase [Porticoccaceae bacterium]
MSITSSSTVSANIESEQSVLFRRPLQLACGTVLNEHSLTFETYGQLNDTGSNAILICHALSGDHHAAGTNKDSVVGWWDAYIGPGKPIDTDVFFVVCPNNIGSCFGSTGPASLAPSTENVWGAEFPPLEVCDWVESQTYLMEYLRIDCWAAIIGGSLGGMQAMYWAVNYPQKLKHAVVIASSLKLSAQNIAFNEVARRAIQSDPNFHQGNFIEHQTRPTQGLALARMIGHLTYLSDHALGRKFGRLVHSGDLDSTEKELVEFEVSSYLNYQGDKFARRFDANSYILITKMLDYFDLGANFENNTKAAFKQATCKFLVISFSSDWRFSPDCSKLIVDALIAADKDVSYLEIDSDQGHDAFLLPNKRYEQGLRSYLRHVAKTLFRVAA